MYILLFGVFQWSRQQGPLDEPEPSEADGADEA